jgi:hypothetical protein
MGQAVHEFVDLSIGSRFQPAFDIGHATADFRLDHQFKLGLHIGHVAIYAPVLVGKAKNERAHIIHVPAQLTLLVENAFQLACQKLQIDRVFAHESNIVTVRPNAHTGNLGQSCYSGRLAAIGVAKILYSGDPKCRSR